jgi:hypothetical protein
MRNALICAARGCDGCLICGKRAPWIPVTVNPAHSGWYEITGPRLPIETMWKWSGREWFAGNGDLANVWRMHDKWRGLAKPWSGGIE